MNQQSFTIQEAARFLGVSPTTLRRWEEKKMLLPYRTVGNQRRYTRDQLESFKSNSFGTAASVVTPVASQIPASAPEAVTVASQTIASPAPEAPVFETAPASSPVSSNPTAEPFVSQLQNEANVQVSTPPQRPQFNTSAGFQMPNGGGNRKPNFIPLAAVIFASVILLSSFALASGFAQSWGAGLDKIGAGLSKAENNAQVLAANDAKAVFTLNVNVPSIFGKQASFLDSVSVKKSLTVDGESVLLGGIRTENADIDAGTGELTASNVVYSIVSGSNITISGDPQNPVISANVGEGLVSSFQGQTGAVALAQGSGIGLDGLTITNTGVLSLQGQSGALAFSQGAGITLDGLTITNSDPGSAQKIFSSFNIDGTTIAAGSNTDTFTFAAGSGVTLTSNTTDKILTISAAAGTASQWTTTGSDIYYNLGSVGIGNTTPGATLDVTGTGRFSGAFTLSSLGAGIVKSDASGVLSSSALDLTSSEVTGALGIANGGTGLASIPSNGQLLIGNGTNYTLGNLTGTTNQILISNGAGSITFSTPQDIHTAATPTFGSLSLTNNTNQILLGSGNTARISMDVLTTNRTYTLPDASGTFCLTSGNCSGGGGGGIAGAGTTNYIAKFTSSSGISDSSIYDNGKIGIGTTSPEGLLTVSGGPAGKALAVFNYTGSGQDILTASASGTTRLVLSNNGNLNIIGGGYQIGGVSVLSDTTLGSGVVNSSLTSVGALSAGSISSGFGNIDVGTDGILGGDITASGTTGLISTGNGAGLSFSGTGNHDITASSGVLRFGAATLTGAITGNGQNITGLGNIAASGSVTFGGLGTGVVQSNGSGLLSSSALNLAGGASYISGTLPTTNGGTGLASYNTGDMIFASAGNTLSALPIGSEGQVLAVSGSGTPTWISTGSLNYWQRANGAIAPINISDDLLIGGIATSSAKFQVFGISGNASTSGTFTFNTAGVIQSTNNQSLTIGGSTTGNITLSPLNGAGAVNSTGDLNLASGKAYQINGANVLTASTLGSGVTGSSLTSVGALAGGSIANGFGTINSNNTITGTTLNGTTGINSGAGAGTQRITNTGNLVNIGSTQLNGVTYTWPGADGSGNNVLTTNGSGSLSWTDVSTFPGVGDITAIGDVTSGAAFTAAGTQGTSLYFYDAQGRGQLTIANLTGPQTYTLPDDSGVICLDTGNCAGTGGGLTGAGTAGQIAFFDGAGTLTSETTGFMWDAVNNKFGLGTDTPEGRLSVSGAGAGKALVVFNETGDQDILTASASGTTMLTLGRNGNLAIEGELSDLTQNAITINDSVNLLTGNMYEINGTSVLNASTLGVGVVNSSLTTVGALASGSIANGFGSIFTANTIQGSDITASGTTGFTASGNGAGLTFSGTGNHIVSASSGTLQIGAATLLGGITGNSQNIVGVNNFSASGTITFGGLSTGIVKSDGSGNLSSSAIALGSADVTGTLAVGNGGTGVTSVGSAGSVAYSNGSTYAFSAAGNSGQVLVSGGTGSPTWVDASTIGTNYWQRNGGLLAPASITDDLAVGGTATSSAKFQIFGLTGNASTSGTLTFNAAGNVQTTNNQTLTFGGSSTGNIVFSPLNGAGTVSVNGNINLASSNAFRINSTDVLTATTLGSGVTTSSLTTVGALASGSIANGFGTIDSNNTITGTTLNATTGINTGAGAGTTRITNTGNLVNIGSTQFNGVTYTWPGADGSSDYVLTTDSAGGLTWKNVTAVGGAGDITAIGDVTSGAAFTAAGTQGTSLYFYDADGRGQLTTANLSQARTYTLPNASGEICLVEAGNCAGAGGGITGSGTAGQISYFDGTNTITSEGSGFAWDATNNRLGIGNDTPTGKLDVTGSNTGKALTVFNETGDQDILTASASGTTMFTLGRNGNVAIEGQLSDLSQNALTVNDSLNLTSGNEFQINGTSVLSASTLGANIVSSSLTSVGALASGSIVNGFGSIFTASTIQGSDITASGTTGFTSSGNGAGLTFSGTGNHSISASGGVLQIGAATLTGAITGNSQSITGVNNFSAGGTITLGGLSTGIVKSDSSGVLSSSAVNLASADVTGTLPVGNGGTGAASFTTNGVVYGNGSSALSVTSAPTGGQVLIGNGSGVPTFMTLTGGVTISNTGVTSIALSSTGETAATSSNSGLEFSTANGLSLLRGCANDQILKWDDTNDLWVCATDSGGAGSAGTINVENNESAVGSNVDTIDFSTDFTVGASPSNEANVSIANDILDFTEIADSLTLDAATNIALSNFNLTLGTNAGNGGVIVSPNAGGNAALIVDKQGTGDIFTASASGTTRFTINTNGYLGLGGEAPTSDQYISAPNFIVQDDGAIYAPSINNPQTFANSYIDLNNSGIELGRDIADSNVALIVNQANVGSTGDILRLNNNAGTMFAVTQAGVLNLGASGYANCSALETVGGVVTCGTDDAGSAGTNYWQVNNGAVSPFSNTLDLLVGGTSTTSAKFAFINSLTGTPTASIAGSTAGNAVSLTGDGVLSTTLNRSLSLNPNGGNVGIGISNPTALLDVAGAASVSGTLNFRNGAGAIQTTGNNTLTIGGNTTGNIILSPLNGAGTVQVNGLANCTAIETDANGTLLCGTDAGGTGGPSGVVNIENNDVGVGTDVTAVDFSTDFSVTASPSNEANVAIADDALNFSELTDTLSLDAGTSLALNNFNFTIGTNAGNGGVIIAPNAGGNAALIVNKQSTDGDIFTASSSGTTRFTISNAGNLVAAGNGTFQGTTGVTLSGNGADLAFTGGGTNTISSTGTLELGAFTLGGAITGNGQDVTGLDALSAGGTITFGGLSTGVVKSDGSGVLSSSAVSLANGSTDITGTLSVANGGTGAITLTQGGVLYGNGTSAVGASAAGTAGQALLSGGTGAPTWTTGTLALAGNFSTSGANALTLTTTGATNVTLPTTGTLATLAGTETLSGKTLTAPRFANGGFIADANGNEQIIFNTTASAVNEITLTNAAASGVVSLAATGGDTNIPFAIDAKGTGELRLNGTGTGNVLLGGGFGDTGCTVTNSTGAFACNGAVTGSNISGSTSGTNTGDQTITLTGDVSGSGTGSFSTTIQDNAIDGTDIALGSDTAGDLMYYNGTDWARLAAGTANQVLHSGATPTWSAIDLAADVTGTLPINRGGTNSTATPTNGGIAYGTGTAYAFSLAGSAGECLKSNGAAAPVWGSCTLGSANYWQINDGAVSPFSNTLDLLVGGTSSASAKFAVLNMIGAGTPTASVSATSTGNGIAIAGDGSIQSLRNNSLNIGGTTTGNIILNPDGNGFVGIGTATPSNALTVAGNIEALNGTQQTLLTSTGSIELAQTGNGAFIDFKTSTAEDYDARIEAYGNGLGIRTNGAGAPEFLFESGGNFGIGTLDPTTNLHVVGGARITGLANCNTIDTDANGVLSCGTDESGGVANYWRVNQGTLSPINDTMDLLVGGIASTSAKFSVLNMTGSGTPTASISATSTGNGIAIAGDGSIQSLRNNTMTIGGNTTGNIVLSPRNGSGTVTISGLATGVVKSTSGLLSSGTISLANGSADISGTLSVANGGTGAVSLTQGGVLYGNATSAIGASAQGTTGQALLSGGTGAPTWTTGTLALAGNFSTSGANALTLTTTGATNVTLPTTGTLATLAGTETLSGKTLTAPRFANGGFIADANGNEQIIFNTTASAVNELSITNAAASGVVALAATGGDTNIPLSLDGKGTGELRLNGTGTGNILLGGGSGSTGCTVTNSTGAFACTAAITASNISGSTSGTNTGDQTITLTGDVSGSGTGSFATTIQDNSVDGTDIALGSDAQGDLMYYNGTDWTRLAAGTANQLLHSGSTPSWSAIDLAADVTGTLPINRGGTNGTATPTNGGIAYGTGTAFAFTSAGSGGDCLKSNGAAAPTWGSCTAGAANYWQINDGAVSPFSNTLDLLIGGTATNSAKFAVTNMTGSGTPTASVSATTTGNGLTLAGDGRIQSLRNNTLNIGGDTTGNITMSPRNGAGAVTVDGELNLTTGNTFQINSGDVLSATTLGSTVVNSSLDSVDALNAGSITSGFGSIDTGTDAITGGTITSTSTTGFVANGAGAGLNLSGTGTHIIQATGTLQINAFTMGGAITGGGNNITGLGQLTVDNLSLDGNTFSATSGDINLSAAGGNVLFASGTTLNVGGGAEAAYNFFADSISSVNGTNINSDNDLYVEGNTEIDGTLYVAATNANGNAGVTIASPSCVTTNNGIVTGSSSCEFGLDTWTGSAATGVVHTSNSTMDVLVGGTATASAKFAITNVVGSNVPVASLSATTASGGNGNGIALNANGSIQSLRNNTLTLGGSTTGNIVIDENVFLGSGTTGLNVTTAGVLSDVNGTAVEINDDLQVTGNDILSSGGTTAITLSGANVTVAGDLTVSGGDIVGIATSSIFDSISTTINMGSAATLVNLMDSATTKVIDIGGVTNGGADTINIATNATGTDTIAIGNANAATTLALTGGDDWSITGAGVVTGTQVNVDNLRLDGNTFSATSGDITIDAAGGDIIIANNDTLNVGGYAGGSAFNVIGSAVTNNNTADGDNDLYIEDELEVDGIVTIGNTTNGIQFDPAAGPTYYGSARITRKLTLSPEYAGAVLTASGSANTNGFMTSDASSSATFNFRQYYEWTSTQTSLQDYTIAVRVTLPPDFSAWATSNAIDIAYNTELTSNTRNKFDLLLFQESSATPVAYRQANVSGTEKAWTTLTVDDSDLTDGTGWDGAGETAVIYLKVYSRDNNHVQIGDIVLNYLTNK